MGYLLLAVYFATTVVRRRLARFDRSGRALTMLFPATATMGDNLAPENPYVNAMLYMADKQAQDGFRETGYRDS